MLPSLIPSADLDRVWFHSLISTEKACFQNVLPSSPLRRKNRFNDWLHSTSLFFLCYFSPSPSATCIFHFNYDGYLQLTKSREYPFSQIPTSTHLRKVVKPSRDCFPGSSKNIGRNTYRKIDIEGKNKRRVKKRQSLLGTNLIDRLHSNILKNRKSLRSYIREKEKKEDKKIK